MLTGKGLGIWKSLLAARQDTVDRNYISAIWPGDANKFAIEFVKMIYD